MGTSSQAYLDILEKTNQQLSLWYNPYGLMVGILTALVAVMTIGFTFLLWRQGKEYKATLTKFFDDQEKNIQTRIDALTRTFLDKHEAELREKMDSVTGAAKEKFQQEIGAVQQAREAIKYPRPILSSLPSDPLHIQSVGDVYPEETSYVLRQQNLTEAQVQSIIALLQSFGADSSTIVNVEKAMRRSVYDF